jgi:hypothetical protein
MLVTKWCFLGFSNASPPLPAALVVRSFAKRPPRVLDPHFVRDAQLR